MLSLYILYCIVRYDQLNRYCGPRGWRILYVRGGRACAYPTKPNKNEEDERQYMSTFLLSMYVGSTN
jgi:hypothetical protein